MDNFLQFVGFMVLSTIGVAAFIGGVVTVAVTWWNNGEIEALKKSLAEDEKTGAAEQQKLSARISALEGGLADAEMDTAVETAHERMDRLRDDIEALQKFAVSRTDLDGVIRKINEQSNDFTLLRANVEGKAIGALPDEVKQQLASAFTQIKGLGADMASLEKKVDGMGRDIALFQDGMRTIVEQTKPAVEAMETATAKVEEMNAKVQAAVKQEGAAVAGVRRLEERVEVLESLSMPVGPAR